MARRERRKDRAGRCLISCTSISDSCSWSLRDHGPVRVLRRRLLLPKQRQCRRRRQIRRRQDHGSGVRPGDPGPAGTAAAQRPGRGPGDPRQPGGAPEPSAAAAARAARRARAPICTSGSNGEVFDRIAADPRFRRNGVRFSLDVYKNLLRQAGINEPAFEESIRRQILAERVVTKSRISRGGVVPKASAVRSSILVEQQREVEGAVSTPRHSRRRHRRCGPGEVVLRRQRSGVQDARGGEVRVRRADAGHAAGAGRGDARRRPGAVRRRRQDLYRQEEQRQAAHILIAVKPDASEAERAAAKKTAEEIAAQARANPASSAARRSRRSQDPAPPPGGDLGSNPRGTMVKAFDDAMCSR